MSLGDYGAGERGVFQVWESKPATIVVFSAKNLWWAIAAPRLKQRLRHVVCVSPVRPSQAISTYLSRAGVEVVMGEEVGSVSILQMLKGVRIVLVDGFVGSYMDFVWRSPEVKLVLVTNSTPRVPAAWSTWWRVLQHKHTGGVTTASAKFWFCTPVRRTFTPPRTQPQQQLRSILKHGQWGRKAPAKEAVANASVSTHAINRVSKQVVHSYGLMDYTRKPAFWPMVRTIYGGQVWVDRAMQLKEKLMALDVPEELIGMLSREEQIEMLKSHLIPIKVYQGALDWTSEDVPGAPDEEISDVAGAHLNYLSKNLSSGKSVDEKPSSQPCVKDNYGEVGDASDADLKAVKHDHARAREELWFQHVRPLARKDLSWSEVTHAMGIVCSFLLRIWKKGIFRSAMRWLKTEQATYSQQETMRECFWRMGQTTEWEWPSGSTPFFWNWPKTLQAKLQEGLLPWMAKDINPYWKRQKGPKNALEKARVVEKLQNIVNKRYVVQGEVKSLTSFFAVPKGDADIRMVYDGTKCGLNDILWAPWFPLPNVSSLLRMVTAESFMSDNDCGEMFLNFPLHKAVQVLCGIDMAKFLGNDDRNTFYRWVRNAMGLRSSPYNAVHCIMWAREVALGDRHDKNNVFRWSTVELNLPGSDSYNPSLPWVFKARLDGSMAADFIIYVDDIRVTGPSVRDCWAAAQRVSSILAWLGLQDAARKRRPPSRTPGAWAGAVVDTSDSQVRVTVSRDRWDKAKAIIQELLDIAEEDGMYNYKRLESQRGFLLYVGMTYPLAKAHLKGIHATLASYHPNRDSDGWKLVESDEGYVVLEGKGVDSNCAKPPKEIKGVGRLLYDLRALKQLFKPVNPIKRLIRATGTVRVVYGFGDASGLGFGSAVEVNGHIHWRGGQWVQSLTAESSNFRELNNLVLALEELADKGIFDRTEIFMFTDNSVAERAYFRGTSSSKVLFELVLRLKCLEERGNCSLFLIHVSGKRMIRSGVDGLSRGDYTSGVMRGSQIKEFVPIHLGAHQRQPRLRLWVNQWAKGRNGSAPCFLEPTEWPSAHEEGICYIWTPPPAAGEAAVEMMANSIHREPCFLGNRGATREPRVWNDWKGACQACGRAITRSVGIFCANLGTARGSQAACQGSWCATCYKATDKLFPINRPKDEEGDVIEVEADVDRFLVARPGDHLMSCFQCDTCHFWNLKYRDPDPTNPKDVRLLMCVRRATLDAFWARESSTVKGNLRQGERLSWKLRTLGLEEVNVLPVLGPWPQKDTVGMGIAVATLVRSLDAGRNDETIQFSTTRRFRSYVYNLWHAGLDAGNLGVITGSNDRNRYQLSNNPTSKEWYTRFSLGMHKRMGDNPKPDFAVSIEVMLAMMEIFEERWADVRATGSLIEQREVILGAVFTVVAYCAGLRGEEVVLMDLRGIRQYHSVGMKYGGDKKHTVIALLGRFKNETGEKYHLMPLCAVTKSGLQPARWIERLVAWYENQGVTSGPVFRDSQGRRAKAAKCEEQVYSALEEIQLRDDNLIGGNVIVRQDYGLHRSFRRGSNSQAISQGVSESNIDLNNRWRKFEQARGRQPTLRMQHHYAQVQLILNALLEYSRAL